jgi:hypothetical protein
MINSKSKILATHHDNKMTRTISELNFKKEMINSNSYFSLMSLNNPHNEGIIN